MLLLLAACGRVGRTDDGAELLWHVELELLVLVVHLRHEVGLLLLLVEVVLDELEGLLVDLLVLMALEELDAIEAGALLDGHRVRIDAVVEASVVLAELEYVVDAVERHLDDLGVDGGQQFAQRRYHVQLDQVLDLLGRAARRGVDHGPCSLLARLVLALGEYLNQTWKYVRIEHRLNLLSVAGGDVGYGPACLLSDGLLGRVEEGQEALEDVAVEHDLGLRVVAGDNVADGAQRRLHHVERAVHEQLDEATAHVRLDDLLYLLVGSVAQIGDGPASVGEHVNVLVVEESGEHGQRRLHFAELDGRILAATQIGQAPDGVARHRQPTRLGQDDEQRRQNAVVEHELATLRTVAGYVAERPHGLLLHVLVRRAEQLDEYGQRTGLDHAARLQRVARGDVGERPGGLELQVEVVALQELDKLGHNARVYDLVDGRIGLLGQQLAEALRDAQLLLLVAVQQQLDHFECDRL